MSAKQRKKKKKASGKKTAQARRTDMNNQKPEHKVVSKPKDTAEYTPVDKGRIVIKGDAKKRISMVAIVKNEEAVLERCVKSVEPIVDEFIIIDTGSTDKTKDIIRKYGSLHELPYTTEVETKQKAIEKATGDYILLMDADEWVAQNVQKLRQYADHNIPVVSARIFDVTYHNSVVTNKYYRNRLFKNDEQSTYSGPGAHGYIRNQTPPIVDRSIIVYHCHDHKVGDPEKEQSKIDRTLGPLREAVKKNPEDSRAWFYLARTLMGNKTQKFQEAIECYQHYLSLITSTFGEERWWAVYDIARCYFYMQDYDNCSIACDRAIEMDQDRAEGYVLKGRIYYIREQWANAAFYFQEAMTKKEPDSQLFVDPREYWDYPADFLATCKYKLGDVWGALELTRDLIGRRAYVDERLVSNLSFYQKEFAMKVDKK